MDIEANLYCNDCGSHEHNSGYYLRKRHREDEKKTISTNCEVCLRPFDILESEAEWKTHCVSCWLKKKGETTKCIKCKEDVLVWKPNGRDLCYQCYLEIAGKRKRCSGCNSIFYEDPNSKISKTQCYSCFLIENGVKAKCMDCKAIIYILEKDKKWKKRCADCYSKLELNYE